VAATEPPPVHHGSGADRRGWEHGRPLPSGDVAARGGNPRGAGRGHLAAIAQVRQAVIAGKGPPADASCATRTAAGTTPAGSPAPRCSTPPGDPAGPGALAGVPGAAQAGRCGPRRPLVRGALYPLPQEWRGPPGRSHSHGPRSSTLPKFTCTCTEYRPRTSPPSSPSRYSRDPDVNRPGPVRLIADRGSPRWPDRGGCRRRGLPRLPGLRPGTGAIPASGPTPG
jgi:hypothetical protein